MLASQQIPLSIHLNDEATFANFFVASGSPNALVLEALKNLSVGNGPETFIYLWGATGLSHLLQATCHAARRQGHTNLYLPLDEVAGFAPMELLESLEHQSLLCLDGLESVVGRPDWDEALFHLYNRIHLLGSRLLVSAHCPPKDIRTSLPDLASRLSWGVTYRVDPLNDMEKQQALQQRALLRGMEMSDEVARFILNHGSREPRQLFECLNLLDRRSLVEKRKLTIPFVKEVLGF
jgi:DnaA family protein